MKQKILYSEGENRKIPIAGDGAEYHLNSDEQAKIQIIMPEMPTELVGAMIRREKNGVTRPGPIPVRDLVEEKEYGNYDVVGPSATQLN